MIACAVETGCYPALTHKGYDKHQCIQELWQLDEEITAELRDQQYEKEIKKNPMWQLKPQKKAAKQIGLSCHGFSRESLLASKIQEGEKLLKEIHEHNGEEKGWNIIFNVKVSL